MGYEQPVSADLRDCLAWPARAARTWLRVGPIL
jgi:hypothetical protein